MKAGSRQTQTTTKRISPLRTILRGRGHGYITRRVVQRRNSVVVINKPERQKKKIYANSLNKSIVISLKMKDPEKKHETLSFKIGSIAPAASIPERRISNRKHKLPSKLQFDASNSCSTVQTEGVTITKKNSTNLLEERLEQNWAVVEQKSQKSGKENGLVASLNPIISKRIKKPSKKINKQKSENRSPPRLTPKTIKTLPHSFNSITASRISISRRPIISTRRGATTRAVWAASHQGVGLSALSSENYDTPPVLSRVDETEIDSGSESINLDDVMISEEEEDYPLHSGRFLNNLGQGDFWCYCQKSENVFAKKDSVEGFNIHESGHPYCQASDLVDGMSQLCARPCSEDLGLYRVSPREPFNLLCPHHIDRLRLHQCCPLCGEFCTQGTGVMMCSYDKIISNRDTGGTRNNDTEKSKNRKTIRHLFHMQCAFEESDLYYDNFNQGVNVISKMRCPHCGNKDEIQEIPMLVRISEPSVPISIETSEAQRNSNDRPAVSDQETHHKVSTVHYWDKFQEAAKSENIIISESQAQIPLSETFSQAPVNSNLLKFCSRMNSNLENVICQDISKGKEPFKPIRCVDDFSSLQGFPNVSWNANFTYVTNPVISDASLRPDTSFHATHRCSCNNDDSSRHSCFVQAGCDCKCQSARKLSYKEDGRLDLTKEVNSSCATIFECNQLCSCDANMCRNRVVQKGIKAELEVYYRLKMTEMAELASWGVRTRSKIPAGTFVCELVGELISSEELSKRSEKSFIFDLSQEERIFNSSKTENDSDVNSSKNSTQIFIDSKKFGNVGRFVNHSSKPNVFVVKVFVEHSDVLFPRVAFFASRNISAEEEITLDSKWNYKN